MIKVYSITFLFWPPHYIALERRARFFFCSIILATTTSDCVQVTQIHACNFLVECYYCAQKLRAQNLRAFSIAFFEKKNISKTCEQMSSILCAQNLAECNIFHVMACAYIRSLPIKPLMSCKEQSKSNEHDHILLTSALRFTNAIKVMQIHCKQTVNELS